MMTAYNETPYIDSTCPFLAEVSASSEFGISLSLSLS